MCRTELAGIKSKRELSEILITVTHTHTNTQLRGVAGKRQVDGARIGLQQNFGIGGAAVVTMYGIQPHTARVAKAKL